MSKPLLFLTGFLGAGKTTLLRGILTESQKLGRSCDVILNDFENAELDAATKNRVSHRGLAMRELLARLVHARLLPAAPDR